MTHPAPTPLLRRLPVGVWVGAFWAAVILIRSAQRPGEFTHLTQFRHGNIEDGPLLAVAVVTTLVASLLARFPLTALAVALAGSIATIDMDVRTTPYLLYFLAVCIVGHIAATRSRRKSIAALALPVAAAGGIAIGQVIVGHYIAGPLSADAAIAAVAVIGWLVGNTMHQSRAHTDALRAQATRQAVSDERLRIARELHDMVAHSVGIIALQAGAAVRVVDSQPERAKDAMAAVETAGRETLSGLRRMLGALRAADPDEAGAPLRPAAGLDDIDGLATATTAAGVRVDVSWSGTRRPLPPDIDLSAFRIIQESVTNVVRHAGTRSCRVSIDYGEDELAIEVADDGRGATDGGGFGFGLAGMRERVALLHGTLAVGTRPEGGFLVSARLPVPAGAT